MRIYVTNRSRALLRSRGMAPLEFVMALPILLLLMVGIVWLGFFVIGQTEVTIEARNKAWKKRFVNEKQVPFMFPTGIGDAKNPEYPGDADYVTETSTTKVEVSPIFAMIPGPKSSHTILAGSWDHSAMPFDKPADWKLVKFALLSAVTGELQILATDIGNIEQLIADQVAQAAASAAAKLAGLGNGGGGGGGGGSFDDIGAPPASKPDKDQRPPNGEEDQRDAQLRADKQRLEAELTQVEAELKRVGDYSPNEPKEKTQERSLLEIKKERIENHISYVEKELGD
jgi:TadE-like protein